ncbi:unnamed protein product, partial [Iphiclides podalirius]
MVYCWWWKRLGIVLLNGLLLVVTTAGRLRGRAGFALHDDGGYRVCASNVRPPLANRVVRALHVRFVGHPALTAAPKLGQVRGQLDGRLTVQLLAALDLNGDADGAKQHT